MLVKEKKALIEDEKQFYKMQGESKNRDYWKPTGLSLWLLIFWGEKKCLNYTLQIEKKIVSNKQFWL